jgi:sialidase-1
MRQYGSNAFRAGATAALCLAAICGPASAAEPEPPAGFFATQDLFVVGSDPAYERYHIPGIVVTAKGTVLAWCEARRQESDWGDIRILLRRSTDDGRTWSEPQSVADVPGPRHRHPLAVAHGGPADAATYNNPVLIAAADGTVHLLFCLDYRRVFHRQSTDDGVSWTQPVEITPVFESFRAAYDWKVLATGPNHGIELSTGRLVVPVWLSTGTGEGGHRPSVVATIVSDDKAATWQAGEIAVACTQEHVNPSETVAVELADGRVMLNVRNESPVQRRLVTTSGDGATGWSPPRFDDVLVEPICMAGLVRYDHGGERLLLFTNPANLERADGQARPGTNRDRRNLTIRASADDGQTWPLARVIDPGPSMYSDVAVTPAGTILCFYGRGSTNHFAGDRLTVARFNLAWIRGE